MEKRCFININNIDFREIITANLTRAARLFVCKPDEWSNVVIASNFQTYPIATLLSGTAKYILELTAELTK